MTPSTRGALCVVVSFSRFCMLSYVPKVAPTLCLGRMAALVREKGATRHTTTRTEISRLRDLEKIWHSGFLALWPHLKDLSPAASSVTALRSRAPVTLFFYGLGVNRPREADRKLDKNQRTALTTQQELTVKYMSRLSSLWQRECTPHLPTYRALCPPHTCPSLLHTLPLSVRRQRSAACGF